MRRLPITLVMKSPALAQGGMMVSDNRERTTFRICPDVTGDSEERPLFQQHISLPTCLARQGRQYHKCHRCAHAEAVYAGVSNVRITAN